MLHTQNDTREENLITKPQATTEGVAVTRSFAPRQSVRGIFP